MKYIVTENQLNKLFLNEYLDKDYTGKLKNYLKDWDIDDIIEEYISFFRYFLEEKLHFDVPSNFDDSKLLELYKQSSDSIKNSFKEFLQNSIGKDDLTDEHSRLMAYAKPNTGLVFKDPKEFKTNWLIHFGKYLDCNDIWHDGFKNAVKNDNIDKTLAFTKKDTENDRSDEGYAYAFDVNQEINSYYLKSADAAVMFVSSGLEFFHKWDGEKQVIFKSSNARNIVFLAHYYDSNLNSDVWGVIGLEGKTLYRSHDIYDTIDWVKNNFRQYHRIISVR